VEFRFVVLKNPDNIRVERVRKLGWVVVVALESAKKPIGWVENSK